MADKVYVGDVGTDVIVDCGEDITGATGLSLKVKKPDGTASSWTGDIAVYNSNYLKYTIQSSDLSVDGRYKVQASLTLGTWTGLGETDTFTVSPLYE